MISLWANGKTKRQSWRKRNVYIHKYAENMDVAKKRGRPQSLTDSTPRIFMHLNTYTTQNQCFYCIKKICLKIGPSSFN